MGWGKWHYFIWFWAEMTCVNSSFRNVLLLSNTFTCSRAALLVIHVCRAIRHVTVVKKNDTILQQYHPNSSFEEFLLSPPLSKLLTSCAVWTRQCCHLRPWIFTGFLQPTSAMSSTPHSFTSQHLSRQTHHSSSGSSLKSPIPWPAPPADLQA